MSQRGVRGVRTVGGFRAPGRRRDLEDVENLEQPDEPVGTGPAVADTPAGATNGTTATDVAAGREAGRVRPSGTGVPRWLVGVLAVIAGLGVAFAILFGIWWNGQRVQADARSAAQSTGQNFLIALTNFDSRNINADFKRITGYATGDFAKQATAFFGPQIRQQLEASQASSRGQISSIYVQSATSNSASVYAVVDQTIVNNKFNAPQADELRIVLTLNKVRAGWRVGEVTVLQAPSTGGGAGSTPSTGP